MRTCTVFGFWYTLPHPSFLTSARPRVLPLTVSTRKKVDPATGRAPPSDQALSAEAAAAAAAAKGGAGASAPSGGSVRTLGQLDPLVVAGVALYVATVYAFWESFRAYFDWSESLAISFIVRGAFGGFASLIFLCTCYRSKCCLPTVSPL